MLDQFDEIDAKEIDLPETVFIRDIENRVFQAITIKCLSEVTGISLLEGNLFDNLLGREGIERVKGIYIEQDSKNHAVNIKVELNIAYGISIPEKAEEIQLKLVKNISGLTGLHVASVHVVFKNLIGDPVVQVVPKEVEEYGEEF
jgi:uncharacterized alkaline shock family protein YloU